MIPRSKSACAGMLPRLADPLPARTGGEQPGLDMPDAGKGL